MTARGGAAMNEHDLRVVKTKESIEAAFLELLRLKPLDRVTVVELAKLARIHKSTFYLHYFDIPDLYAQTLQKTLREPIAAASFFPAFFDAPESFLDDLGRMLTDNLGKIDLLMQDRNRDLFLDDVAALLRAKVYETVRIAKSTENDIRLDLIFTALLVCMPRYYEHRGEVNAQVAAMLRRFFPQVVC